MVDDFVQLGLGPATRKWRSFLYDDGVDQPAVAHLNGSRPRVVDRLQRSQFGRLGGEEPSASGEAAPAPAQ
jgi:hypothetical protein